MGSSRPGFNPWAAPVAFGERGNVARARLRAQNGGGEKKAGLSPKQREPSPEIGLWPGDSARRVRSAERSNGSAADRPQRPLFRVPTFVRVTNPKEGAWSPPRWAPDGGRVGPCVSTSDAAGCRSASSSPVPASPRWEGRSAPPGAGRTALRSSCLSRASSLAPMSRASGLAPRRRATLAARVADLVGSFRALRQPAAVGADGGLGVRLRRVAGLVGLILAHGGAAARGGRLGGWGLALGPLACRLLLGVIASFLAGSPMETRRPKRAPGWISTPGGRGCARRGAGPAVRGRGPAGGGERCGSEDGRGRSPPRRDGRDRASDLERVVPGDLREGDGCPEMGRAPPVRPLGVQKRMPMEIVACQISVSRLPALVQPVSMRKWERPPTGTCRPR